MRDIEGFTPERAVQFSVKKRRALPLVGASALTVAVAFAATKVGAPVSYSEENEVPVITSTPTPLHTSLSGQTELTLRFTHAAQTSNSMHINQPVVSDVRPQATPVPDNETQSISNNSKAVFPLVAGLGVLITAGTLASFLVHSDSRKRR